MNTILTRYTYTVHVPVHVHVHNELYMYMYMYIGWGFGHHCFQIVQWTMPVQSVCPCSIMYKSSYYMYTCTCMYTCTLHILHVHVHVQHLNFSHILTSYTHVHVNIHVYVTILSQSCLQSNIYSFFMCGSLKSVTVTAKVWEMHCMSSSLPQC